MKKAHADPRRGVSRHGANGVASRSTASFAGCRCTNPAVDRTPWRNVGHRDPRQRPGDDRDPGRVDIDAQRGAWFGVPTKPQRLGRTAGNDPGVEITGQTRRPRPPIAPCAALFAAQAPACPTRHLEGLVLGASWGLSGRTFLSTGACPGKPWLSTSACIRAVLVKGGTAGARQF